MFTQRLEDNINENEKVRIHRYLHTKPEPPHKHEFIEIVYIYCGHGKQIINNTSYTVQRGDVVFMGLNDIHSFETDNQLGIINCLVAPDFLSTQTVDIFEPIDILSLTSFNEFTLESISPVIKFSLGKYFEIESLFDQMVEEFSNKKKGYILAISGLLQTVLVKIFRQISESNNLKYYKEIEKITPEVIQYIEKNYHEKINLSELARISFYSPSYFSKIFKECFGKSLTQYINELRINEAIDSLSNDSDLSIEDIAYSVGFSDKKQFYKVFKELTGKTPGDYKK